MKKALSLSLAVSAAAFCGSRARANYIPNYSFESPMVSGAFPVSLAIDHSATTGPAAEVVDIGSGPQNSGVGIFPNPSTGATHFTNAEQNQLAYMFSGSTHTLAQVLSAAYQPNTVYSLTVGVGNAGSLPTAGDQLSIQLYYTTAANPGTPIPIATRNVVEGTDALSQSVLTDFTASTVTPLTAGSPALGRPVGLLLTTTGTGGGEFDLDNVRISPDVPEPASIGFMGLAGILAMLRRRGSC